MGTTIALTAVVIIGLGVVLVIALRPQPNGPPGQNLVATATEPEKKPPVPPAVAEVESPAPAVDPKPEPTTKSAKEPATAPPAEEKKPAADSAPPAKAPEPENRGATSGPRSTREIVTQCERGVAKIEGKLGTGTGFVAAPGIIATNAHVIRQELVGNLKATFPSENKNAAGPFPVRLIYKDSERDLALLQVESAAAPLELARLSEFPKGEDIIIIGNPGGLGGMVNLENAVTRGVLSAEADFRGQRWYQLSMSVNPGNSGGPVLDSRGRVIGIVTLKARKEEGHGYCIPVDALLTALERVDGITAKQRLRVEDRHAAQSVFEVYRDLGGALITVSALHVVVKSRDARTITPDDAKKLAAAYEQNRKMVELLDGLTTTYYAPALVRVAEGNDVDTTIRSDLTKLRKLVEKLGDAFEHSEGFKGKELAKTVESSTKEFERLCDRLGKALDLPNEN